MEKKFKVGQYVRWRSQSQGKTKVKLGQVLCAVPAYANAHNVLLGLYPAGPGRRHPYVQKFIDSPHAVRNHKSYLVTVAGDTPGAQLRIHWPMVKNMNRDPRCARLEEVELALRNHFAVCNLAFDKMDEKTRLAFLSPDAEQALSNLRTSIRKEITADAGSRRRGVIKQGDCLDFLKILPDNSVDSLVTDPPAGISFMGKGWDGDKGGRAGWVAWMTEVMRECHRVLKPGAHGLVWALPRTSHWTAIALEDAGFEIRDKMFHIQGQGFPKSLNIKQAGVKNGIACGCEDVRNGHGDAPGSDTRSNRSGSSQGPRHAKQSHLESGAIPKQPRPQDCRRCGKPILPEGLGTALKPAVEEWVIIRKPCSEKTVAANVIKHGTGGLNIDASRVATEDNLNDGFYRETSDTYQANAYGKHKRGGEYVQPQGRFPSHLILDEFAGAMLDEQSGVSKPKRARTGRPGGSNACHMSRDKGDNTYNAEGVGYWPGDNGGGASRFFYCAKISSSERGEGNSHPTVKPQKLMRYLITLITPPGGMVLDPFAGSGSTGVAAKALGFNFLGIEQNEEYAAIAAKRIESAQADAHPELRLKRQNFRTCLRKRSEAT